MLVSADEDVVSKIRHLFLAQIEHAYLAALILISILFFVRLVVEVRKNGMPHPIAFAWRVVVEALACFIMAVALLILIKLFDLILMALARLFPNEAPTTAPKGS